MNVFDKFFYGLYEKRQTYGGLTRNTNRIIERLDSTTRAELKSLIENYSCLSNRAIQFLTTAMVYSHGWDRLYREIERNIEEEKGSSTGGIPHLVMMREGYKNELGIDTSDVRPFKCTTNMLNTLNGLFLDRNKAYVAGAVLAFESVAIEEFNIIDSVVRRYLFLQRKEYSGLTKNYIEGHKSFEIEHSRSLERAIAHHIKKSDFDSVSQGHDDVCYVMSCWWFFLNNRLQNKYHRSKDK